LINGVSYLIEFLTRLSDPQWVFWEGSGKGHHSYWDSGRPFSSPDHQQDAAYLPRRCPGPSARSIALHHEASRDPHRDASNFGVVTST
jgi:hypothetical protein